ncbi:putative SAM domain protein [Trichinella spiralis]|uniref:Kazrin-A n=2 Tax=Trichinella spiralis TaxID=6334 RepID=E5SL64_TRISP|nr:putative SAM domain protein [Trichinella spiralis]KRY30040.1 Kazrin-A [Trichinella spiralis]
MSYVALYIILKEKIVTAHMGDFLENEHVIFSLKHLCKWLSQMICMDWGKLFWKTILSNNEIFIEINRCHNQLNSLRKEVAFAKRRVDDLEESMMISDSPPESDMNSQATQADQKRLRHEKAELFNQMKELCDALEKKESHIKEFVRTLEQRVQESDMQTKQLLWEKQKLEAEYSKATEQLSKANQQLSAQKQDLTKEQQENSRLQASLKEMQGRFLLLTGKTVYNCEGANSVSLGSVAVQSDDESSPVTDSEEPHFLANGGAFSQHLKSSSESTLKDSGAAFERIPFAYSFRRCRSRKDAHAEDNGNRLSKLLHFAKSKAKVCESLDSFSEHDPITQELNLAERADYLLRARSMPLSQWKLAHITAWLRLEMGMIHYVKAFESNVKSGKALAELSDFEMENTLGIANPMHKKKLRLALDEYRVPSLCKYPCIKEMTHHYIGNTFLPSIGLPQYSNLFLNNLVDGRVLNALQKKHLVKHLSVTKRLHQAAILAGIETLRMTQFDVKLLTKNRSESVNQDSHLLWWTNERVIKWVQQIDLAEYADNLRQSGVHGALFILDSSFGFTQFAEVLRIPSSKQMPRRHLQLKFSALVAAEKNCESPSAKLQSVISEFANDKSNGTRHQSVKNSFVKVFGLYGRRSTSDARIGHKISTDLSWLGGSELNRARQWAQSTGTLSSVTSDLGSSIERSKHMKAILSTPQVLAHAPMTGFISVQSGESAERSSQSCLSPVEDEFSKSRFVRLRKKKSFNVSSRPHSMGDFCSPTRSRFIERLSGGAVPLALRLKNWLSSERLHGSDHLPEPERVERVMGPIAEYDCELTGVEEKTTSDSAFSSSGSSSKQSNRCCSRERIDYILGPLERPRSLALPGECALPLRRYPHETNL